MARVSLFVPESGEKSYKLTPHRPVTIGRDPGNDIVLRDAKVSRHHARIIYERGFYVLHDLSSSNGTFINGKRIRVAPLTDRAELRIGNCTGRFSEELDEPTPPRTEPVTAADEGLKPTPPAGVELATAPHPMSQGTEEPEAKPPAPEEEESGGKQRAALADKPPAPSPLEAEATAGPEDTGDKRMRGSHYFIDLRVPEQDVSAVRDENESPLFFFRNPVSLVGFVARLVAAMISISGAATAIFLFWQRQSFPGLTAVFLTVAFLFVILMLIPRQQILLYSDAALSSIAMMLIQETRFSFPSLRFTLRKADGSVIGRFQKNLASNFGRRRWWILDRPGDRRIGYAKEESLPLALLRLIVALVRTNFRIYLHGRQVGFINRRAPVRNQVQLDLRQDPSHLLDRRLAIGLAVLIDSVEGR
jgi:hypothetical protein